MKWLAPSVLITCLLGQTARAEPAAQPDATAGTPAAPEPAAPPTKSDESSSRSKGSDVESVPGTFWVRSDADLRAGDDYGKSYPFSLYGIIDIRNTALKPTGGSGMFTDQLSIQRARLLALGYIKSPRITYFLNAGFSSADHAGASSALFDAVITMALHRDFVVRVGQFAYSLDRQQPIPPFFFQFVDRSPVLSELGADEDIGLQVGSADLLGLGGKLGYKVYVGGGEGRNQPANGNVGRLVYVARVEVNPFGRFDKDVEGDFTRKKSPRLSLGVGAGFNDRAQKDRGNFGAPLALGGFGYYLGAADVTFKYAGLSLLAEATVRSSSTKSRTGVVDGMDRTEYSRNAAGAFVQAGYMTSTFVELAARYSQLFDIGTTAPDLEKTIHDAGKEAGAAASWYVFGNHGFKLQGDYFYQFGSSSVARHQARLQLQASF